MVRGYIREGFVIAGNPRPMVACEVRRYHSKSMFAGPGAAQSDAGSLLVSCALRLGQCWIQLVLQILQFVNGQAAIR
jgi:hypothetical protein